MKNKEIKKRALLQEPFFAFIKFKKLKKALFISITYRLGRTFLRELREQCYQQRQHHPKH